MNIQPLVTIGIPFYNAEAYLSDAIKSVIVQTYKNWELILIDDGSIDNSLAIAKSFVQQDSRIRIIFDGQNKKLPARLNQIIHEAKGSYIARMDADDIISPQRIELQIDFLQASPEIDLISTGILSLKNDLTLVGYRGTTNPKSINLADAIMGTTGIIHASVVAKKDWFLRNLYNENNRLAEDYELWLTAYLKNDLKVGFIEKPLYYYREDQSIQLKKLLTAYDSQIDIISKTSSQYLDNRTKRKFINKFLLKKLMVRMLFLTKQEGLLHKRRVQSQTPDFYIQQLQRDLSYLAQGGTN